MANRSDKQHDQLISCYSKEQKLVLYCSRTRVEKKIEEKILLLIRHDINWQYFLEISYYHKVVPIVYNCLKQLKTNSIPSEIIDKLGNYYQQNAFISLAYAERLEEITKALRHNDIDVMSFKGPVLADSAYNNLALRDFGDIDLLIQESDLSDALSTLADLGYPPPIQIAEKEGKPYLEFSIFHESGKYQKSCDVFDDRANIVVEIHWSLFNESFLFPVKFEHLWQHKNTIFINDKTEIHTFCIEDLLIYLCAHASKHSWTTLQWICDINELICANPKLNWQKTLNRARKWGCFRMLCLGLILSRNLLDTPLPKKIVQLVEPEKISQLLAKQVEERLFNTTTLSKYDNYIFISKCRERNYDKLTYLFSIIFTPNKKDWHFIQLPTYLYFLYYIVRLYRLLYEYFFGKVFLMNDK